MPTEAPISLTTPIEAVRGVGPRRGEAFRRLGVPSVAHLIHYLPVRHEREARETTISELPVGQVVSARGEITATRVAGRRPKVRFEAVLVDHTGRLDLVWFNGGYLRGKLHPGMRVRIQGKSRERGPGLQVANPDWEILDIEAEDPAFLDERLRPVYPGSEDLSSKMIEQTVREVLDEALPLIDDHLPEAFCRERDMPRLTDAYRMMHRPEDEEEVAAARRRLAYDELLLLLLGVHMRRQQRRSAQRAAPLTWSESIDARIRARIPFTLTKAQDKVVGEIAADLRRDEPANRLIQGDVGSGKTVVALYAMLMAVADRRQAALMAPTELLAEQHHTTIAAMLAGADVRVGLLTASLPAPERADLMRSLEAGEIDILIGTHALLTEHVRFKSLAVAVIDEQHRFGVHQRAQLRERNADGASPHTLVMTATPIPRTLALTVFGDLDVSTIDALPPGRTPITTRSVSPDQRAEVYTFLRDRIDKGDQAYIVVPAIDSEGDLADVRTTLAHLEDGPLRDVPVSALHGRLKRDAREQIMSRFRAGRIRALVATTVIEVGVDVPDACIMIVEHAERFGIAQLHQLRGRVGRGDRKSVCVLIGAPATPEAEARLKAVASTTNGFHLAERDLEIRGPGEFVGARQSGLAAFRIADLPRDLDLLMMARRDAGDWIAKSPNLDAPADRLLRSRLMKTHGESLGLADVA